MADLEDQFWTSPHEPKAQLTWNFAGRIEASSRPNIIKTFSHRKSKIAAMDVVLKMYF